MRHVNLRRNNTKRNKDSGVCWMQTIVLPLIKRWPSTLIRWKIHAGSHLYNPVTGQIAPEYVNVGDSLLIGERMAECYSASLPGGFYAPISCPIKTMSDAMKSKRNPDKPAIDLEYVFIRLMMIGQRRQLELGPLFDYELSAVPAALIDEQGCLRKGNRSALVKSNALVS